MLKMRRPDRAPPRSRAAPAAALRRLLARLWQNRRGNVLIIAAFALIPLTFATGMAVDYSRAARLETKLDAAADAASLSAVTKPMLSQSIQAACNAARQTFLNSLQQYNNGLTFNTASDLQISITETYAASANVTLACPTTNLTLPSSFSIASTRVATVTYTGLSANAFGGVLGQSNWSIGGTATARAGTGGYYQIVFLVDVSNSMAIGGTAADITSLSTDRTIGCSFACHDPNGLMPVAASGWCDTHPADYFCHTGGSMYCPWGTGNCGVVNPSSTYSDRRGLAKLYGYKLKIDYVKDALNSFMTQLSPKMVANPSNYNVALYTFGSKFTEAQPFTNSSTTVQTAVNNVDVETAAIYRAGYANQGWTYTTSGLQSTLAKLTNIGDGSSATKRKTYVIFLSDGVEDDLGTIIYNRGTYYNYTAQCKAIQNAGVTMFSIEAQYPVITDDSDGQYRQLITNLPSRNSGQTIADSMKMCASSSDRYFLASDGPAIQTAVNQVFSSISADTTRLSN